MRRLIVVLTVALCMAVVAASARSEGVGCDAMEKLSLPLPEGYRSLLPKYGLVPGTRLSAIRAGEREGEPAIAFYYGSLDDPRVLELTPRKDNFYRASISALDERYMHGHETLAEQLVEADFFQQPGTNPVFLRRIGGRSGRTLVVIVDALGEAIVDIGEAK